MRNLSYLWREAICATLLIGCGSSHDTSPDASGGDDAPPATDAPTPAVDAASPDGTPSDAAATFGLTSIFPKAASRTLDTALTIDGVGFSGTPAIHLANCDQPATTYDLTSSSVTPTAITATLAADPTRVQGVYTVTVTNGDGMSASLTCALRIVAEGPPTVSLVVPTTAWQGVAADGINSDATIGIRGTGFISTPSVRWVSTTDPTKHYDATFVGFVSATQLTAVVPSETLAMPAGTYNVFVTNPDNLTGEWMNAATPGVYTITATPPPVVTDVSPARVPNNSCSSPLTLTGTGFQAGATAWYVVPAGTTCAGSTTDPNGQTLCPITVDAIAATSITAHFASCPALGPYPIVVIDPDGQASYWYDVEITDSSAGHLNTGTWETATNRLETARFKHSAQFGFDAFSNAFEYIVGGQDGSGNVLGSVEASQLDLFGTPGPFHHVEQYGSATQPRVSNDLTVPREGTTTARVGKSLFAIGGTPTRSDSSTPVAAPAVVERAEILSYQEMPGVKEPTSLGGAGLPTGSWYYKVSAIGPWGESLATREVVAIDAGGQIQVCWAAPVAGGATSYNIYRSLASDGRLNTSAAIAYEVTSASSCFTDTGTGTLAPAPGNVRGTLAAGGALTAGTYTYRVSATVPVGTGTFETYAGYASATAIAASDVTAGMMTVNVAWDPLPITGATYRVYRLDPLTSTYKLLAGADALTTTSFADTGVAFAASGAPRTEVRALPTGSLSKWSAASVPALGHAREGLDSVVIAMDPATSNNQVARILVAGGRDGTGGTYAYRTTAESLGIYKDGTTEASWYAETPVFAHARVYYPLLSTEDRNTTPFPPPPDQPTCGDCNTVIQFAPSPTGFYGLPPTTASSEPIYVIAAEGDDAFAATQNSGRSDFESCLVDASTGHLAADCGVANSTTWVVQSNGEPAGSATFGNDGVLYFSYLYPFGGVQRETVGAPGETIQLINSASGRFPLIGDLTMATGGQVLQSFQSASTSFNLARAYYQMSRLLAYVYVFGGYAGAHTDPVTGLPVAAGPTDLVERHQQ